MPLRQSRMQRTRPFYNKVVQSDPFWVNTILQTTGDGTNGAVIFPNLATNSPGPPLAPTGTCALSNAQSEYGATSIRTTGTTNYCTTLPADALYQLGTAYTIEYSIFITAMGSNNPMRFRDAADAQQIANSMVGAAPVTMSASDGGVVNSLAVLPWASWQKICICRNGGTLRYYINGALQGSAASATTNEVPVYLEMGFHPTGGGSLDAYFSNIRVTKAARYTGATYSVAAGPFPVGP